jgi:hypothetical protein
MERTDSSNSTSLPAVSQQAKPASADAGKLFHSPIDRSALMRRAHAIARRARAHMASYREAFAYALHTAWSDAKGRQEHRQRFAGHVPRILTAKQLAASRYATRRCGASYMPF